MRALLQSLLGGVWGYVAVAGFAASIAVGATLVVKNGEIARIERDQAKVDLAVTQATLSQFRTVAATINVKALEFSAIRDTLNSRLGTISKDLKHAIAANPLPDGCRPDVERMRSIESAIAAANAAAAGR